MRTKNSGTPGRGERLGGPSRSYSWSEQVFAQKRTLERAGQIGTSVVVLGRSFATILKHSRRENSYAGRNGRARSNRRGSVGLPNRTGGEGLWKRIYSAGGETLARTSAGEISDIKHYLFNGLVVGSAKHRPKGGNQSPSAEEEHQGGLSQGGASPD